MTKGKPDTGAPSVQQVARQLTELCRSIKAFKVEDKVYVPPIIDRNEQYHQDILPGLARFSQTCQKEAEWVNELAEAPDGPSDLTSSNAPFLFALWEEVKAADLPLVAVNATFPCRPTESVKVDVVADNGRVWVKCNTIRLTRLLREFREQDSYINSDSYSSDPEEAAQSSKYPITPLNAITKQCYDLFLAAKQHKLKFGSTPKVVYRLTRMDADEHCDDRVQATYNCVRRLGIDLRFGDVVDASSPTTLSERHFLPSLKINLDLSLLIALISDISHSALPETAAAADERFKPFERKWKRKTDDESGQTIAVPIEDGEMQPEEQFRALASQLKQEMVYGLVDDLDELISMSCRAQGAPVDQVEFWTTQEAKIRCESIVRAIGGPSEKQRASQIWHSGSDFWSGSRYAGRAGALERFWVRVMDDDAPDASPDKGDASFVTALGDVCDKLLRQNEYQQTIPLELVDQAPDSQLNTPAPPAGRRGGGRGRRRHANVGPPQTLRIPTAHTVRSMREGARRGMTTITANRQSVKQIVRAIGSTEGLREESTLAAFMVVEPKTLGELKRSDQRPEELLVVAQASAGKAALWSVEPRSLAEQLRTD